MIDARFWTRQAAATARMTRDLPAFVRRQTDLAGAQRAIIDRLERREARFLGCLERAVYAQRSSPYLKLLRHAGIELGDVRRLVATEGVEGSLAQLARSGVRVNHEQLKGRQPIVSGSLQFMAGLADFQNPLGPPHFLAVTSGSTGRPALAPRTLSEFVEVGQVLRVRMAAYGVERGAIVQWATAPHSIYPFVHAGLRFVEWWCPTTNVPRSVSVLQGWVRLVARTAGYHVPKPRCMPLDRADEAARALVAQLRQHESVWLNATVSAAVATSAAATRLGLSLRGVFWAAMGEPLTPARSEVIRASVSVPTASYSSRETGIIAVTCAHGTVSDEMHVLSDRFALIQASAIDRTEQHPRSMLVTSLTPTVGTTCLNLEMGDEADIQQRACECAIGGVGLNTRLFAIGSHEKLTGQGVTMLASELTALVERSLPERFGGTAGDFQLVEQESADGAVRLVVVVHPRLGEVDEMLVRKTVLAAIAEGALIGPHRARLLSDADAIVVRRLAPLTTTSGKAPHFVPLRSSLALPPSDSDRR
jgi:phenylacetate-coenzyme A ligase PaaK-like adenylate-forming protein